MGETTFRLSDESVNGHGFITKTDGIQIPEHLPMLYVHNDSILPIGEWKNIRKENGQLLADALFDQEDEFAQTVARKVEKGLLRMCSIGFDFQREDVQFEVMNGKDTMVVSSCLLLEASICPVGSNRNAVKLSTYTLSILSDFKINQKNMEKINSYLGLKAQAGEDEILQLLQDKDAKIASLQAQIEAKDLQHEQAIKSTMLSEALTQKKIAEAEQTVLQKLSIDDLKTLLSARKPVAEVPSINEAVQMAIRLANDERKNWTFNDWRKQDPAGLALMRENDTDRYEQLKSNYLKTNPKN